MVGRIQRSAARYLGSHLGLIALVASVYVAGIVIGALAIPALDSAQRAELAAYVDVFLRGFTRGGSHLASIDIMRMSLSSHLRDAALIWVLGVSVIGSPVVVVILFVRGFVAGFTAGFLAAEMGRQGVLLASLSMVPHSIISVPALVILSVASLGFAVSISRQSFQNRKIDFLQEVVSYTGTAATTLVLFAVASLIEAYITPAFIRVLAAYIA